VAGQAYSAAGLLAPMRTTPAVPADQFRENLKAAERCVAAVDRIVSFLDCELASPRAVLELT